MSSSKDTPRLVNHAANLVSRLVESDTEVSTVDLNLLENLNTNQSLNYIKLEENLNHIEANSQKLVQMPTCYATANSSLLPDDDKYIVLSNRTAVSPEVLDSVFSFTGLLSHLARKKPQKLDYGISCDEFDWDSDASSDCELESIYDYSDSDRCSDSESDSDVEYGYYQLDSAMRRRFTPMKKSEARSKLRAIIGKFSNQSLDPVKQMVKYMGLDEVESKRITKAWSAFYRALTPAKAQIKQYLRHEFRSRKERLAGLGIAMAQTNTTNSTTSLPPPFPVAGYRFIAARRKPSEPSKAQLNTTRAVNDTKRSAPNATEYINHNVAFDTRARLYAIVGALLLVFLAC